jgi:hypothetical protein
MQTVAIVNSLPKLDFGTMNSSEGNVVNMYPYAATDGQNWLAAEE